MLFLRSRCRFAIRTVAGLLAMKRQRLHICASFPRERRGRNCHRCSRPRGQERSRRIASQGIAALAVPTANKKRKEHVSLRFLFARFSSNGRTGLGTAKILQPFLRHGRAVFIIDNRMPVHFFRFLPSAFRRHDFLCFFQRHSNDCHNTCPFPHGFPCGRK